MSTQEERDYRDSLTGAALIHYHMEHYADDIESDGEMDAGRCLRDAWRQHAIVHRAQYDALLARVEKYERAVDALGGLLGCLDNHADARLCEDARAEGNDAYSASRMQQENGGGK